MEHVTQLKSIKTMFRLETNMKILLLLLISISAFAAYNPDNIEVDLDAFKIAANIAVGELPDEEEERYDTYEGAFLPVNDDDDDYSATLTDDGSDKEQEPEGISQETDLLPIILHKVGPDPIVGSVYTLTIPNHIKVWKFSDRTGLVVTADEFDANVETTLYVEGITKTSDDIKINWTEKPGTAEPNLIVDLDRVTVTTFQWVGALNVPGYSSHKYVATGALPASKWSNTHTSGNNDPGTGPNTDGQDEDSTWILWDGGPSIGKATYNVNANYTWDLEVNVVQITFVTPVAGDIVHKNFPVQGVYLPNAQGVYTKLDGTGRYISASATGDSFVGKIIVDKVEGPMRGGANRGVKFLEMGITQEVKVTQRNSIYPTLGLKRKSKLEDNTWHLDTAVPANPAAAVKPWYDNTGFSTNIGVGYFKPANDNTINNDKIFAIRDSPMIDWTDSIWYFPPVAPGAELIKGFANRANIIVDFKTYFSVRTIDDRNDSHKIYTERAKATWQYNGSGSIVPDFSAVWGKDQNANNSGDNKFSIITSGAINEKANDAETGNELGNGTLKGWTDVPLP